MLLARMPQAFHQAAGQRGVLTEEDCGQQGPRPARQPNPPPAGMEGIENLGARIGRKKRATPVAAPPARPCAQRLGFVTPVPLVAISS
jgi:hypothetical protein